MHGSQMMCLLHKMNVSAEEKKNCCSCSLIFPCLRTGGPESQIWQQGLTFWSVICSMSAPAEEDTNLWSADHIVSYYVPLAAEEQHLFRVPGSHENNVSEPVHFFYTLLVILSPEISWLVPWGGNVNWYFRGVDVWIIRLAAFILHYTENISHSEQQSYITSHIYK